MVLTLLERNIAYFSALIYTCIFTKHDNKGYVPINDEEGVCQVRPWFLNIEYLFKWFSVQLVRSCFLAWGLSENSLDRIHGRKHSRSANTVHLSNPRYQHRVIRPWGRVSFLTFFSWSEAFLGFLMNVSPGETGSFLKSLLIVVEFDIVNVLVLTFQEAKICRIHMMTV